MPGVEDVKRHEDSSAYRVAAVRECFEESGILLAKRTNDPDRLLEVPDDEREKSRHMVHQNQINFVQWVQDHGGRPDTGKLSPKFSL